MSFDERKKWERQMPNPTSSEALAHQNLRAEIEAKIKRREQQQKALTKLREQVQLSQLKKEQEQHQSDMTTKPRMDDEKDARTPRIDEKPKAGKLVQRQEKERVSKEQLKLEKGKDEV